MLILSRSDRPFRRRTARRAAPRALTVAALVLLILPITADGVPHCGARKPGPRKVAVFAARTGSTRSRTPSVAPEGRPR